MGGLILGAMVLATAVAGCTAGSPVAPDVAETPAASAAVSPSTTSATTSATTSPSGSYPQGASADTPECQDASAAVVAAVNATFDDPTTRDASGVDRLVASPDPDHAVWLLTGVIPSTSGSEGYLVAWATTADPTAETFEGALRSIGGVTATMSSAPSLQFADIAEPGGFPVAATRCAPQLSRDSIQ